MSPLVVGVPKEIKDSENRVAVQPDGVAELVYNGNQVLVEREAGTGSRFSDAEYAAAGAEGRAIEGRVHTARDGHEQHRNRDGCDQTEAHRAATRHRPNV